MKFSVGFNRDYDFYLNNLDNFNFSGTPKPKYEGALSRGKNYTAKECFHMIESGVPIGYIRIDSFSKMEIKMIPCTEPELLNDLLLCKAGVNFQIKQWAEGMADGSLLLFELSVDIFNTKSLDKFNIKDKIGGDNNLVWENGHPVYYKDIQTQYKMPDWVVIAVLNQSKKMQLTN